MEMYMDKLKSTIEKSQKKCLQSTSSYSSSLGPQLNFTYLPVEGMIKIRKVKEIHMEEEGSSSNLR